MIKINATFLILFTLVLNLNCIAQNNKLTADTILARTLRISHSDSSREARIKISSRTLDARRELSYGKIWWTPGHMKMTFWDTVNTKFIESQVIEVYDTFRIYRGQPGTMHIYSQNENPSGILSGNLFFTGEKNFNQPRLDSIGQDLLAYLALYPIGEKAKFTVLKITVDLRTYRVIAYKAMMKNGTVLEISLMYTDINKGISPDEFIVREKDYPEYTDFIDHRKE